MKELNESDLKKVDGGNREVTWADVNGDGTLDKIVSRDGEIIKIKMK